MHIFNLDSNGFFMSLHHTLRNKTLIGVFGAFSAYLIWGLQPLYWKAMQEVSSWTAVAHRYCWTTILLAVFIVVTGLFPEFRSTCQHLWEKKSRLLLLFTAAFVAAANGWINIIAPMTGQVVQLGSGLFLTPLMSILLGVLFFKEKLNTLQKFSIALAAIGVGIMLCRLSVFPWVSLGVSSTWAVYGALKKKLNLAPVVSIFLESLFIMPIALVYLSTSNLQAFWPMLVSFDLTAWGLVGTGILTAVPLIAYNYSTNYLPMSILGFCQYIGPILTLVLGVFVFGESFETDRLFAMSFVWSGIVLFLFDQWRSNYQ